MKILLKNVRLAFPHLYKAHAHNAGDTPAFSAAFIFPKDHPQVPEIEAAIKQVAEEKWGAKADANLKAIKAADKTCLHDGDIKANLSGYEGNLFINARSATRPGVYDRDRTPLTEEDGRPYAGCYVNTSLDIYVQDNNYGKRINASLSGVQFFKDGEAFSGGRPASADDFDDLGFDDLS